jgi:hypothetical protein
MLIAPVMIFGFGFAAIVTLLGTVIGWDQLAAVATFSGLSGLFALARRRPTLA